MKENAILKINQIGKAGQIISNIFIGLLSLAAVALIIGTIVIGVLPNDLVCFSVGGHATVNINLASINEALNEAEITEIVTVLDSELTNAKMDLNGAVYAMNELTVTTDGITFGGYADDVHFQIGNLLSVLIASLFSIIFSIVTLCFISSLCKAFKLCISPFENNVIKKMQYFAFSLIPWVIMSSVMNSVASGMYSGNIRFSFGIDLKMVLIILVIFVLTFIFKYGAVLQQESDETL